MPNTKQAAPKGLSQVHFGMFNPRLSSRKAAEARTRDIAPKTPILSYFTSGHYGELHPADKKALQEGYKRFGIQRGSFAEPPTDAFSGKMEQFVGGVRDITAPESTISEFWKDRSNLGAFNTQLLKAVKDLSPAVLGDLSPNGRVFKEWARQNGFVTPEGAVDMKAAEAAASAAVEAYDDKMFLEKKHKEWYNTDLSRWLKYVAGEYRTPWSDDDLLGPAETTEVKFAESVYKDLVSSKYNALNGLRNSIRKFNEGARLLSEGAARSARQASPRARALLKRDIEYLRDFRGVVESMMKDFSVTLSAPASKPVSSSAPAPQPKETAVAKPEAQTVRQRAAQKPSATPAPTAVPSPAPAKQPPQVSQVPKQPKPAPVQRQRTMPQWAPRSPYEGFVQFVPWENSLIRPTTAKRR